MAETTSTGLPGNTGSPGGYYTRKATGLVREISVWDSFWMNMTYCSVPLSVLTFTVAPFAFPGVNLFWCAIAATVFAFFPVLVYGMLAATMPRSGGDYVWQSRILHPLIGFASNFNLILSMVFFTGVMATWISGFAGSSALLTVGTVTGNETLVRWSATANEKGWQVGVAIVFILIFGALAATGTKITFRAIAYLYVFCLVGQFVTIGVLLVTDNGGFQTAFNHYAPYSKVLHDATTQGGYVAPHGFSVNDTLAAVALIYSGLGFGYVSTTCSGEVKSASKNSLYSTLGSVIATGLLIAVLAALSMHVFSTQFLGSITALSYTTHYPLAASPFFYLFAAMATSHSIWVVFIGLAFEAGVLAVFPALFMIATRSIFAWSFDRVMPGKLAEVNPRTHTPVNAVILVTVVMVAFCIAFLYIPIRWTAFIAGLETMALITFFLVGISAAILPWRRPDIWATAPYRWMIGPLPVITLAGIFTACVELFLGYYLVTNPGLGANGTKTLILIPMPFLIGCVWFLVAAALNNRQGVSLVAGQTELPPE
jgi:basic amino acid/polyamine antiporter, APA family